MSPPGLHIQRGAFLGMVISSVETFKRECLGYVFGYKPTAGRENYLITSVHNIAMVSKRKNAEIEENERSRKRLTGLFEAAPALYRYLGDFHSHPEWGTAKGVAELSEQDIKNMLDNKKSFEIVIAVNSRKKGQVPWEVLADGGIRGSLDKFNFHMAAFTLDADAKPVQLKITAPAALKALNRVYFVSA